MNRLNKAVLISALALVAACSNASAHAFLERAVPGVGATVTGSPGELQLSFTEDVVVALSSVRIASTAGGSFSVSKATGDGKSSAVLHVRLGRTLGPGTYTVTWNVVAVDTHRTSGSYKFTVAP